MLRLSRALSEMRKQTRGYLGLGGRGFLGKGPVVQRPGGMLEEAQRPVWLVGNEVGKVARGQL